MADPSGISTRADLHQKLQELFDRYDGSYLALGTAAGVGQATIHDMVGGKTFPRWSTLERVLVACGIPRGELEAWRHAHVRVQAEQRPGPGRRLSEMTDPFALEVHHPVQAEDIHLPPLPQYVRRDHDGQLAEVIDQAVSGRSVLAVLVGESSTGKTRACWEALARLRSIRGRQEWRLWHPIDPSRPDAVLASLTEVGPHTVVWLNEAQLYLDTTSGEEVAARLRELLRTPERGPVLILATLWRQHWDTLTTRPDRGADLHAQARELLLGRKIHVPTVFTSDDTAQLARAAADDARLAQARAHAADGRITQYLAGVPALLDRYHEAPPAARALIHAAIDARRLGHGPHLSRQLLADAAHGYLDDTEWNSLDDDWINAAFAYAARPCNGIPGPLTRVRPRASAPGPPLYRLADYLEQAGRTQRANQYPPDSFWAAAVGLAHHDSLYPLGRAAAERGLLQAAARLWKRATSCGHARAAAEVVELLAAIDPHDSRAAQWAAQVSPLHDPGGAGHLLGTLQSAGADEQVSELLGRNPAGHARLNAPGAVSWLLESLGDAKAYEQVAVLMERDPACHVSLEDLDGTERLLEALGGLWVYGWVTELLEHVTRHGTISLPDAEQLLSRVYVYHTSQRLLRDVAEMLGIRHYPIRQQVAPGTLRSARSLLESVRRIRYREQRTALLERVAQQMSIDDPGAAGWLIARLREQGANDKVAALLRRDPARHAALDDPAAVSRLLGSLRHVGAHEQVEALLSRDPARRAALDDLGAVSGLLRQLHEAGTNEQTAALADRAAQHSFLNAPQASWLLESMRHVGASRQADLLLRVLPVHGHFQDCFLGDQDDPSLYRYGCQPNGEPASPWTWDDLEQEYDMQPEC